jgi:hypothetical protein
MVVVMLKPEVSAELELALFEEATNPPTTPITVTTLSPTAIAKITVFLAIQ